MTFRPGPGLSRLLGAARRGAEGPVYLVGGSLRDALLNREARDADLAVKGGAKSLAGRLARELGGTLVVLDEATRVYRVVLPPSSPHKPWAQIDVAQIQGKDIQEDLLRRDFPVNAMAWPLGEKDGKILDPRGGLPDLRRRLIRADRPRVFLEDPLRLLRAFRQAAQLGFRLEPAAMRHIRAHRRLVRKPAGERIRQELLGILSSPRSRIWIELMDKAGVLTSLFPELEASRNCARVYYGRGGVLKHSLDATARMDFLLEGLDAVFPEIARDIRLHCARRAGDWERAQALLRLAALLHDVAKPATARRIGGRLRFFGHDSAGARQAEKMLRRLRFSNDETALVAACIRHHLRPGNLAANRSVSDKAAFRFFRDVGSDGVPLLLVCWADHASYIPSAALRRLLPRAAREPFGSKPGRSRGKETQKTLHHLQVVGHLLRSYFQRRERILPPRLLDGNEVMRLLNLPPGPSVGKALRRLQEAQAGGKVQDRAGALRFLKKIRL